MKANGYGLDGPGSNPCGDEILLTRTDLPWGPTQPPAQRVTRPGFGVDNPLPSTAEVKEKVEVYLYSLSVPLWHIMK